MLNPDQQAVMKREWDRELREIWKIVLSSVSFDEQEASEKAHAYVAQLQTGHSKKSAEILVRAAVTGVRDALDQIRRDAES